MGLSSRARHLARAETDGLKGLPADEPSEARGEFVGRSFCARRRAREVKEVSEDNRNALLLDHVDARMVAGVERETAVTDEATAGRNSIVQLDPDHPGFRDSDYRAPRNLTVKRSTRSGARYATRLSPRTARTHAPNTSKPFDASTFRAKRYRSCAKCRRG